MKTSITGKVSVEINAPASRVWEALTNPEQIKKYLFGTAVKSSWKVGSSITFSGEWEGKPYEDKGTIMKLEREKTLQYSYWSSMSSLADTPENYQIITYGLTEKNGQTTVTVIQENCQSEASRDHSEQNWSMVLNTLKGLLEK
jgi:uncharacterized protein YndB with AHSA1/START domain